MKINSSYSDALTEDVHIDPSNGSITVGYDGVVLNTLISITPIASNTVNIARKEYKP